MRADQLKLVCKNNFLAFIESALFCACAMLLKDDTVHGANDIIKGNY